MRYQLETTPQSWWPLLAVVCACAWIGLADPAIAPAAEDLAICDQVEDELMFDQAVNSVKIDISCRHGIITLEGTVDNLRAKERARRLAETVRGVLSVVNLIEVQAPEDRTDSEIRTNVESALLYDPATDAYEVDVDVDGGVVTLTGTVDSWQEKNLSEFVAKGVSGVTGVDNQIDIDVRGDRLDAEIQAEVERVLRRDVYLDGANLIDVSVEDGEVTLTGMVGSALEKSRAQSQAWVTGVVNVDNAALEVKDWIGEGRERNTASPTLSDSEIEDAVQSALFYDPRTISFTVEVSSINGFVTLRGTVDNLKAKRAAEQDARNTIGVYSVANRLRVRSKDDATDADIQQRVEEALSRNPYTEDYEMTVSVNDGTVNLYGTVDSYFDKAEADDVASSVRGVNSVDNHLLVSRFGDNYVYDPYVDGYNPYTYNWYDYDPRATFKTDSEIEAEINDELWWSPFVDSEQVSVTVEDGTATLTGTVDSVAERQAAAENAIEGGAISVDNELKIE